MLEKFENFILKKLLSMLFELFLGCLDDWMIFNFSARFIGGCIGFLSSEDKILLASQRLLTKNQFKQF